MLWLPRPLYSPLKSLYTLKHPSFLFLSMPIVRLELRTKPITVADNRSLILSEGALFFSQAYFNEWIVTEKLGDAHRVKLLSEEAVDIKSLGDAQEIKTYVGKSRKPPTRIWQRFYYSEIGIGIILLLCGCYDVASKQKGYFVYLFLQGIAFLVTGFGYVGTYVSDS